MAGSIVPIGPWTGPVNWNMCATGYGQVRIPFSLHVQPVPTPHAASFLPFHRLPTELQLHILRFCDSAALFQLMRVSSVVRKEAQKLFWAQPHVWHLVDGAWLLLGGLPGGTHDAIDALGFMQRVEVNLGSYEPFCKIEGEEDGVLRRARGKYTAQDRMRQIQDFWQVLQRRLPRATHVIFSENFATRAGAPLPSGLRRIAEQCPPGICAYVSWLQKEPEYDMRVRRSLWRPVRRLGSSNTSWEVFHPTWTQQTILPPPKSFSGPVGAYSYLDYRREHRLSLRLARRLHVLQAVEMYYTEERCPSFICPSSRCQVRFELPAEWTAHAVDARHNSDIILPSKQLQDLFAQHDARLAHMEQQDKDTLSSMRVAWGEEGSQQRREAEDAFLHQLQHDPLYTQEEPPRERLTWHDYNQEMDKQCIIR